ncbi:ABC transporter ATP-binding protein [Paenibacillus tarimensis]
MFLTTSRLNKTYRTGDVSFQALKQVSIALGKGEIGVILGPSGSGKSTLMNMLGAVDRPDEGDIIVDHQHLVKMKDQELTRYRREHVGFVFQFYNLLPNLTVYENVELAANISKAPMKVDEILHAVGLGGFERRFPRELSGGQQQRTSIARALVKNPKLLLCDEPTGALDYATSIEILKLLDQVNRKFQTSILIITHNEAISGMAHRTFRMRSGEVIEACQLQERINPERIEW